MKKKNKQISIAGWLFYSMAFFILAVGFVSLFAKQFKLSIPFITDVMIPLFDNYAIKVPAWGTTGSYADVVSGQHWVFLILLGIAIIIAIIGKQLSNLFLRLAVQRKKSHKRVKTKVKKQATQPKPQSIASTSKSSEALPSTTAAAKKIELPPEPDGKHKNFADLTKGLNK